MRKFFEMCHSATQQQVIQYRKTKGSPLDLDTHINQYVRSFNPPLVPHIKLEPTSLCDVDFEVPGEPDMCLPCLSVSRLVSLASSASETLQNVKP